MDITVIRQQQKDIDSTNILVVFKDETLQLHLSGHINNRTNFVHLTYENYHEELLQEHNVEIDAVTLQIEDRDEQINFV